MSDASLRSLPSVHRVLQTDALRDVLTHFEREPVTVMVRGVLAEHRADVAQGQPAVTAESLAERVAARIATEWRERPRHVINATGVILHTNLGRAPLSERARLAVSQAAGYCDLEYDTVGGGRGSRQDVTQHLFQALTNADASLVTVNNAAAVTLALAALARNKEVIVSRGEAVEIGGGFRVPVILRQSGARLVEVGTTNRTRLSDFEDALTGRTAAILHVHSSNFRITGFTEQVALQDLASLAHRAEIPLIDDNGSGSLLPTERFGLRHEPTPQEALRAGADIVAFSGDKLLGGPQCGILLGASNLVERIGRYPLARMVRPDKLTLAALSATLLTYLRGDAVTELPVWQMIAQTADELAERSSRWQRQASRYGIAVHTRSAESTVGGGSLPGETLPTTVLTLPAAIRAEGLRASQPSVIARTQGGRVLLDLRTVLREEEEALLQSVKCAYHRADGTQHPESVVSHNPVQEATE